MRARGIKFAKQAGAFESARVWAAYECPVVNHPTQMHLLDSKLFNMRLAVGKLNGLVIAPGEVFSFWHLIGRPTAKSGFKAGPTFENGRMVTSFGGGLCQISGLIFNLALESGCEILERSSHSLDAYGERRYLPLGRDATVAWMSKDLVFRNVSGIPIRLVLNVERTRAFGHVEGIEEMPFNVRIDREDFDSIRSNAETKYVDAIVTRAISSETHEWRDAGRFTSQYRTPAAEKLNISP